MNEVLRTILHRRSVRRFAPEQIEEGSLQQILQAGLYAPSAGGRQGVLFVVSQNREVNVRLGKIKRANSNPRTATAEHFVSREQPSIADDPKIVDAFYGAPTVITLFAPKNFLFGPEDCAAAAENMLLAATDLGLGSLYVCPSPGKRGGSFGFKEKQANRSGACDRAGGRPGMMTPLQ